MKIAIIQRFLPSRSRGGVGYFTHGLACALTEKGHAVTIFSQDPAPEGSPYRVELLPSEGKMGPLRFPFDLKKINFSEFDIIHAQGDEQWIPHTQPVVRTLHGSSLIEAWHNGILRFSVKHFLLHLYFYIMEFVATLRASRVISVSRHTTQFYFKNNGVIPNGIPTGAYSAPLSTKTVHPVILFVGELHSRKRGALLLKIFKEEIRPQIPKAELWMVCPETVDEAGVKTFKNISQEKLIELYQSAWIFCLPSSYEGFGRPYAEALAAGTPVVATINPGAEEVLANGKYGILTETQNLAFTLLNLLRDAASRKRYADLGKKRAEDFDWKRVASDYEKIYQSLTDEK